ncbi:carbon-nitrogen hydrolase [Marinimicrobium sp. ABcell2]|uniref:carbon-nitrogen hydrolase n=1 Tax=Marinimicrobium sp. ABcell2 TaxID=3069751 RepID=UPI0027B7D8EB|nr:carbon-nitrogen hydrolase [Marinimicrobium sp. ABcell2]MDQ2075656.1 carbon-nitrogen hydrolase [Marinimicrobium sp. ABcell2]
MTELPIGLVQQACSADLKSNLETTVAAIRDLATQGARLVVLQELHRSVYFCQQEDPAIFDLAESIPGPTTDVLGALARELNLVIVASLFERRAPGLYHNTAVVLDSDGSIAGQYRKMHIPDDPGFYEKFYFTPGDMGFQPIATSVGKLGVLVCWDQWFPEAARLMAMAGAEVLIYPTAIGWSREDDTDEQERQRQAWVTIQRSHAIANGLPVVAVNRVGYEDNPSGGEGIDFWGTSFVAGPQGEILYSAGTGSPENALVKVDLARSESVRRIWPYLRDRRIDHYGDLLKLYRD